MRTKRPTSDGGDRRAPQAFYNAAFKILGKVGHEELTVDSLCARLDVTKGSFYHHFANTAEFVAGLLQCWEDTIDEYFQRTAATPTLARALEAAWQAHLNRPHEAEAALRSWANTNPIVAATVARLDRKLEAIFAEAFAPYIEDPERRRVIAFMWLCQLAGAQHRPPPLDRQLMAAAALEFIRTNLGIEAEIDGDQLRVIAMPRRTDGRSD